MQPLDEDRSVISDDVSPLESLLGPLLHPSAQDKGDGSLLDLTDARLTDRDAVVLSAALLGSLGQQPLKVALPNHPRRRQQMTHAGLLFALANRPGVTHFLDAVPPSLKPWRHSFSVGSRAYGSLYRSQNEERSDQPFGRTYACFVNPHQSVPDFTESEISALLRPWLYRLLPDSSEPSRVFVQDLGATIDDLLANINQHAARQENGQPAQSLLTIQILHDNSHGRDSLSLFLSVIDNGPGIVRTARPKLPALRDIPDDQLLRDLFLGCHSGWGRQRGLGLPDIWKRLRRNPGASLLVATHQERLTGYDGVLRSKQSGLDVHGSTITLCFRPPTCAGSFGPTAKE